MADTAFFKLFFHIICTHFMSEVYAATSLRSTQQDIIHNKIIGTFIDKYHLDDVRHDNCTV